MPPPSASASASASAALHAAHWVADALAADETIDFFSIKALVGVSSESLVGAPDAVRERVALRCLQELAAFAVADEGAAAATPAPAPAPSLRFDAARSCEDLLVDLTAEVGSSRSLDKDIILPFTQDIWNFICIKKSTLSETSLELLREVDPEIQSMASPSPVEQNGIKKHENNQSLCNISHLHSNIGKPRLPTDSTGLQQENLTNLVNEYETGNFQKFPVEPTADLDQPCASDSRFNNQPQEDAASVGARSPEKNLSNLDSNMSVAAVPASASCNATLQGNIAEPLSKEDTVDQTTVVQPQPCEGKSPNPPHYNGVIKGPNDDGTSDHSLKDPSHESQTIHSTMAPAFDRSNDVLPPNTSEASHLPEFITTDDTTMIQELHSCKTHANCLQHDSAEKVNKNLDDGCASVIPSVSCSVAMQGDKSETNHPPGNTTEHTAMLEQQNGGDKSHLDVTCAEKDNQALYDDGTILEKNNICGGLNVQTAPESRSCNAALHDNISKANYLFEQNIGKNTTDIQKHSCSISVPNSSQDGDGKRVKQDSNKKAVRNTVAETSHVHSSDDGFSGFAAARLLSMTCKMPFCSQDQGPNGSLGGLSEQDLCIRCGKDGQLLKCSSCLLSAHNSCFGSLVTFEDSGRFYCPVCFYTKATEAYQKAKETCIEARKNLAAFLGTKQLPEQHDKQQTGVLPRSANSEGQLNGCNSSKRQNSHQTEADDLAHQGEEFDQQRKKQKINGTGEACTEAVIEKASSVRNSDVAPMNEHPVLQNISNQVQDAEQDQQVENTGPCEDGGNGYSSHERRNQSRNRCSPNKNPGVEADKEDTPAKSHQSEDSDEIEATSSNDSGNRSSPPWRNMRHHKTRLQEREATVSSNSRKVFGQQDQHMPSPSRKRNYAYPPKRYSNPVVPTGRRSKLCWTEEEEAALREAMEKFSPQDNGPIPWVQILEHGRDVFHQTRLPSDLRVKWRNMKKKSGS